MRSQSYGEAERSEFLTSMGAAESGLDSLVASAYSLLGLITYFTAGKKEVRAWTVSRGAKRTLRRQGSYIPILRRAL